MEKKITVAEGLEIIQSQFSAYLDGAVVTKEIADEIVFIVNNEIQLRDYVLGMANDYVGHTNDVTLWLEQLIEANGNKTECHALLTIVSAYYYDAGERDRAYLALNLVYATLSNKGERYSLEQLLRRVYDANWAVGSFAEMRNELHEKVKAQITDESYSKNLVGAI
jgi:hypothetical protein